MTSYEVRKHVHLSLSQEVTVSILIIVINSLFASYSKVIVTIYNMFTCV